MKYFVASLLILFQLFLFPVARISYAQEISKTNLAPTATSRLNISVGGGSTLLIKNGKEEALRISDYSASTRLVEAPAQGSVSQKYYPYGQTQDKENTITDKQFTNHRNIAEAGVYHAGARFYNPQLATFIQADKVRGPNRYAYVGGNPITFSDPSGKDRVDLTMMQGAGQKSSPTISATGTYDPDRLDKALMTDNQFYTLTAASLALAGAAAAPTVVTAYLGNPALYTSIAGGIGEGLSNAPDSANMSGAVAHVAGDGFELAKKINRMWAPEVPAPLGSLHPRYFAEDGTAMEELLVVKNRLMEVLPEHLDPDEVSGIYIVGSNSEGVVKASSDLDILVYTRNTRFVRQRLASMELQIDMNPQIRDMQEWFEFTQGVENGVNKADLVDMFVDSEIKGRKGDGGQGIVYDILNERWANVQNISK